MALLRCADLVRKQFTDPELISSESAHTRLAIQLRELASDLKTPAGALRAVLEELEGRVCETRIAQEERTRAKVAFEADFAASLRLLVSLADLAGQPELAGWIRRGKGRG